MGRASGRHSNGRHRPQNTGPVPADLAFSVPPDSAEGREIGVAEKPLPGGRPHIRNKPVTQPMQPAVPEPMDPFRGMMAHGVPDTGQGEFRERREPDVHRREVKQESGKPHDEPSPVPVYVVEGGRKYVKRIAVAKNFKAPALGAQPVEICGYDPNRVRVLVLNEDSSHTCRVGQLSDLAVDFANNLIVGGSLLPGGMTSYLALEAQNALYLMSTDTNTPRISVIIETEVGR